MPQRQHTLLLIPHVVFIYLFMIYACTSLLVRCCHVLECDDLVFAYFDIDNQDEYRRCGDDARVEDFIAASRRQCSCVQSD